jgi:predicted nucleotidyltransferase
MVTVMRKQTKAKQIVRKLRDRLEKVLDTSVQVILYGSYARGEAKEGSDIDVLVIVPNLDARIDALISEIAWEIGFEAGVVLSVIPVSQDELLSLKASPFLKTVLKEGIKLCK